MAVYTPAVLRTPTNITASSVTVFTASGGTVMRSFRFNTLAAHSVFLSIGAAGAADAVTNRLLDSFLLTVSVPYQENGWWELANTDILTTHADSIATNAPVFGAWGVTWV